MAQPSAQREPSMEEILASIRRIIEDSDNGRGPGEAEARPANDEPAGAADRSDVANFRAELADEDMTPLPPARPTLAEIGETVHAGHDAAGSASVVEMRREPEPVLPEPRMTSGPDRAAEIESGAAGDATPISGDEDRQVGRWQDTEPAPSHPDAGRGIISDQAGRQVAAAFEELSEAFSASRKRSFDEMAEEMMRPMLQDWLDNNLPLLVERLVREEIERVARGTAR